MPNLAAHPALLRPTSPSTSTPSAPHTRFPPANARSQRIVSKFGKRELYTFRRARQVGAATVGSNFPENTASPGDSRRGFPIMTRRPPAYRTIVLCAPEPHLTLPITGLCQTFGIAKDCRFGKSRKGRNEPEASARVASLLADASGSLGRFRVAGGYRAEYTLRFWPLGFG